MDKAGAGMLTNIGDNRCTEENKGRAVCSLPVVWALSAPPFSHVMLAGAWGQKRATLPPVPAHTC